MVFTIRFCFLLWLLKGETLRIFHICVYLFQARLSTWHRAVIDAFKQICHWNQHHLSSFTITMTLANILTSKFGLHPPERLTRTPEMTPQRLKVITILIITGVFRFTMVLMSNLYSIPAFLVLMTVLKPLRHYAEEVYWYLEGILFRWLQLLVAWWMWSAGYSGNKEAFCLFPVAIPAILESIKHFCAI